MHTGQEFEANIYRILTIPKYQFLLASEGMMPNIPYCPASVARTAEYDSSHNVLHSTTRGL
jgi:hypothetical protein